jgi:hypothetical protein
VTASLQHWRSNFVLRSVKGVAIFCTLTEHRNCDGKQREPGVAKPSIQPLANLGKWKHGIIYWTPQRLMGQVLFPESWHDNELKVIKEPIGQRVRHYR